MAETADARRERAATIPSVSPNTELTKAVRSAERDELFDEVMRLRRSEYAEGLLDDGELGSSSDARVAVTSDEAMVRVSRYYRLVYGLSTCQCACELIDLGELSAVLL